MSKKRASNIFKNKHLQQTAEGIAGTYTGQEVWNRFDAAWSELARHLAEQQIESIGATVAAIVENDNQAGWILLEKFPDIVTGLLRAGAETIADVFEMGRQVIPFGARLAVRILEISPVLISERDFETLTKTAALACSVSQINTRTAESLIMHSPVILSRIGFEGLRQISAFAAAVARSTWAHSITAVEESPKLMDRMTEAGGDIPAVITLYRTASRMALEDWNIATDLVSKSPSLTAQLAALDSSLPLRIYQRASDTTSLGAAVVSAFLNTAAELIGHLGEEASESVWQCAFLMAADHPDDAAALLNKSPKIVRRLNVQMSDGQAGRIFQFGRALAEISSQLTLKFLTTSVEFADNPDPDELKEIAGMTRTLAQVSHAAAGSFLDVAPIVMKKTGMEGLNGIHALGMKIAGDDWETASRLISKSPDLIERIGLDGLRLIGDIATSMAGESHSAAAQLLDKCPAIIDGLRQLGDASLLTRVCRLGEQTAKYNARVAVSLLSRSPEIIRLVGFDGLEKIADLARRTGSESWTTSVSLLESSPRILEKTDFEGLSQIADLARLVARQNSYGAVSLLEKSPDILDRLLTQGDLSVAMRIYAFAADVAVRDWILATTLLEESPSLMSRIGTGGLFKLFELIQTLDHVDGKIAKRLLDISPPVIDKMGFEGLKILAQCALAIGAKDAQAAVSVLEKSPRLIDQLDQMGDKAVPVVTFGLVTTVARTSVPVSVKLLEKSPELIQWVGLEGFGMIVTFVENAAKEDEEKALSYLSGDSPAFSDFLDSIPKGLELKPIKHVLSTYLRALLGRRVEIAEAETVYTDGRKIYLPRRIRDFQDQEDNFQLYKVSATHQEAHLEYGSYEFDISRIPEVVQELTAQYGIAKDEDQSDMDIFTHLFPEPDLARDLFNLLEDYRIENILRAEYPALGDEISAMNRHLTMKRRPPAKMVNGKQRSVEMLSQSLLAGKEFDHPADPAVSILRKALDLSVTLQRRESDVHDAARVSLNIYPLIDKAFQESYRPVKPISRSLDQDTVSQNIGSFGKTSQQIQNRMNGRSSAPRNPSKSQVEAQSNAQGDTTPSQTSPGSDQVLQREHRNVENQKSYRGQPTGGKRETDGREQSDEGAAGTSPVIQYDSPEKIERMLRALYREKGITPKEIERRVESLHPNDVYLFLRSLEAALDKKTELQSERGTSLYQEWGEDINDYRANWSRVREQTQPGASMAFYRETSDLYAGLLKKIRREFQMLKPEGFTKLKRQYDGDDIDLDAVVEFLVDRRAGISPSEKNYTLIQKRKRDIAVAFLIDMSRSTKGETIEREKESLIIMSEALHEVGDAFAIFGFSGDNRDNVDFYRIKDFDDAYNDMTKQRISAIQDHFENRDGTAIRHTISKLRKRPERTKLMILLSDGKPVDKEYSGTYAIEDTRMALKEAQHFGIKTFCITVDHTAAEYLPRMYSHSSWTVIDDVVKLPEKITRIYRMLTA